MPINVRTATSGDLDEIAAIHKASILVLCESHYSSSDRDAWTADLAPERYQTFHRSDDYLLLVGMDRDAKDDSAKSQGNNLLGFGILDLRRGIINAVYVRPSAAGRGVGRAIVEALEREALNGNISRLTLNSSLNAVPFYEKLGYVSGGCSSNNSPSGTCLPCMSMSKELSTGN